MGSPAPKLAVTDDVCKRHVDMLLENTTVSVEVMVEGKWQVASLELVRLKNKARAYTSLRVTVACA